MEYFSLRNKMWSWKDRVLLKLQVSIYLALLDFLGRSTAWIFGSTPPWVMVTPERNLFFRKFLLSKPIFNKRMWDVDAGISLITINFNKCYWYVTPLSFIQERVKSRFSLQSVTPSQPLLRPHPHPSIPDIYRSPVQSLTFSPCHAWNWHATMLFCSRPTTLDQLGLPRSRCSREGLGMFYFHHFTAW